MKFKYVLTFTFFSTLSHFYHSRASRRKHIWYDGMDRYGLVFGLSEDFTFQHLIIMNI